MKRPPLPVQIVLATLVGAAVGLSLNLAAEEGLIDRSVALQVAAIGEIGGKIFLNLLKMVVVPLVFSSIVASITSLGTEEGLARLGGRTLAYYLASSAVAIAVGLTLVNLVRPGQGTDFPALLGAARGELATRSVTAPDLPTFRGGAFDALVDIVFRMIPTNIFAAGHNNGSILAVIFFALVFAVGVLKTGGESGETLTRFFRAAYEVMLTLTNGILQLAPIGICGYLIFVTAGTGLQLVGALAWYMATVALGLLVHGAIVLPLVLVFVARRDPIRYARDLSEALVTAFSTASSSGTLPVTLRNVRAAGVQERVASFTLPLGSTLNMDGTALYEVVAVLFLAQAVGDLTLAQQGMVAVTGLLVSVGAAGIPHAGTVMMVIVLEAARIPVDASEAILVMLAVDRVLDMARTTVNVWSDAVAAAVVDRFEIRSAG